MSDKDKNDGEDEGRSGGGGKEQILALLELLSTMDRLQHGRSMVEQEPCTATMWAGKISELFTTLQNAELEKDEMKTANEIRNTILQLSEYADTIKTTLLADPDTRSVLFLTRFTDKSALALYMDVTDEDCKPGMHRQAVRMSTHPYGIEVLINEFLKEYPDAREAEISGMVST